MNEIALLIAASLSAGTPLALAGLGLLINEKVGVVNLGAEGMMLIAAVVGFATAFHTGSQSLGFVAGAAAGALSAGLFGVLAIWLNTNQYATGLAVSLFGGGFSAFVGVSYVGKTLGTQGPNSIPVLGDIPFVGLAIFQQHPMVYGAAAFALGIKYKPANSSPAIKIMTWTFKILDLNIGLNSRTFYDIAEWQASCVPFLAGSR